MLFSFRLNHNYASFIKGVFLLASFLFKLYPFYPEFKRGTEFPPPEDEPEHGQEFNLKKDAAAGSGVSCGG